MSFVYKSVMTTLFPFYPLLTLNVSVKFFANTLRIGMIELSIGIRMPLSKALVIAELDGIVDGM